MWYKKKKIVTKELLKPTEFIWLLKILHTDINNWGHKYIASRFVYRILTFHRNASKIQIHLLKHHIMDPYRNLL
jgi:hypothetical protein